MSAGTRSGPIAIIAEDEPLLAAALERMLAQTWPELDVARVVHDGDAALQAIEALEPHLVFLDIRMPGRSGLEVARQLAERPGPVPEIVFVTAYDQYAVEAFDAAALDYLLKPVTNARLERCVERLRRRLAGDGSRFEASGRPAFAGHEEASLKRLLAELEQRLARSASEKPRLRFLLASVGEVTRQIPVSAVLYFEARDKYVAVVTRDASALVRMPLSELLAGLDPEAFAQIHRSTIVRLDAIDTIRRDLTGRSYVHLRERVGGREVKLAVSRQYAARFRGM